MLHSSCWNVLSLSSNINSPLKDRNPFTGLRSDAEERVKAISTRISFVRGEA